MKKMVKIVAVVKKVLVCMEENCIFLQFRVKCARAFIHGKCAKPTTLITDLSFGFLQQ